MDLLELRLINYLKSLGLEVYTKTKARGHLGFYSKNRIDISKNVPQNRVIPTLLHEFAHYVHSCIEPSMEKTGGDLSVLFDEERVALYEAELIEVTNWVDTSSKFEKLKQHKTIIQSKILEYESIIKSRYPKFQRSKKFHEFDKYIKKSKAKYLLKYDRVKLVSGVLFKKIEMLTIDNIEKDFVDMPKEFAAYIRLKSCQKRQARISAKINKLKKYYSKPTELFARFIEGLYLDSKRLQNTAPYTYKRFSELLGCGYYPHLLEALDMFVEPKNFVE